jgi:hypothetical protein
MSSGSSFGGAAVCFRLGFGAAASVRLVAVFFRLAALFSRLAFGVALFLPLVAAFFRLGFGGAAVCFRLVIDRSHAR